MSAANELLDDMPSEDWGKVAAIIRRFEAAWQEGEPPEIDAFLPAPPAERLAVLIELVHVDLEYRWKAGKPLRVEEYFQRYEALRSDERLALQLIASEYHLEQQQAPTVGIEDYARRFPHLADRLEKALAAPLEPGFSTWDKAESEKPTTVADPPACETMRALGFELLGELGRGASSVVYRARQIGLDRLVAVKMILAGPHAGPEDLARFRMEGEAAARLQHPNIVQIHSIGEEGGRPFFVLEYVAGGSLAQKLAGTPLPPQQAASLAETLACAIHVAHSCGIVHRDLKPANILLQKSEIRNPKSEISGTSDFGFRISDFSPKITDFGLAKRLDAPSGLTVSGAIMGTPSYMAPEQAEGKASQIGPATDVYALGAILYETLTGRPPFRAATPLETMLQLVSEDPVPPGRLQKVPRDLETICLKCLNKDAPQRYVSAKALADDLRAFLVGEPIRARRPSIWIRGLQWARRRPLVASLAAALVLALTIGFLGMAGLWLRSEANRHSAQQAQQDAEGQRAKAEERLERMWLANGRRLLDDDDYLLSLCWFLRPLENPNLTPEQEAVHRLRLGLILDQCPRLAHLWVHEGPILFAAYSPDGRFMVTTSADGTAQVWDAQSGVRACPPLRHEKPVVHAAFSPTQPFLVTASWDHTARIWDLASGRQHQLIPHEQKVGFVAYSPDGQRIVTTSADETARVWDAASGRLEKSLDHQADLNSAFFSADNRSILTAGGNLVRLWDAGTGEEIVPPFQHQSEVTLAALSQNGKWLVTLCGDGSVRRWDRAAHQSMLLMLNPDREVQHLALGADGTQAVTADKDGTIQVWSVERGQPITPPLRHSGALMCVALSAHGHRVLAAGDDGSARVWNTTNGNLVGPCLRHGGGMVCAAFSPDGGNVLLGGEDGTARTWEIGQPPRHSRVLRHGTDALRHTAFSPQGDKVVTAGVDGRARVWDTQSGKELVRLEGHKDEVFRAQFNPEGTEILTTGADSTARVWDIATGRERLPPLAHVDLREALYSPDGTSIVTVSDNGSMYFWDATGGTRRLTIQAHDGAVRHAAFSDDGRRLVTAGRRDGTARVWDAQNGTALVPPLHHDSPVLHVAFSAGEGRHVLTACEDGTAWLWDVATGQQILPTALRHDREILDAALSAADDLIVTASADKTARVWDGQGRPVAPPFRHAGEVLRVAFGPHHHLIVTGSADGSARLWNVSGQAVSPPLRHEGNVIDVAFSRDSRQVLTASTDGTARLWDLHPEERPIADLLLLLQAFTGQQLDQSDGFEHLRPQQVRDCWERLRQRSPAGAE
jgi:WD40 repeat protein/serine/threonine protein kinase